MIEATSMGVISSQCSNISNSPYQGVGVGLGVGLWLDTGIDKGYDKNLVGSLVGSFGAHVRCKTKVCVFASVSFTVC